MSPGGENGTLLQYLCWKNPWTEETGWLQSMVSQRVGHDGASEPHTLLHI